MWLTVRRAVPGGGSAFGIATLLLSGYLVRGTGLFSDDFESLLRVKDASLLDLLAFRRGFYFVETPVEYLTHFIPYSFFDLEGGLVVDAFKITYTLAACGLLRAFFGLYLDDVRAWVAAWLVLFFPSHDATAYWFQAYYLPLSVALYAGAFLAARRQWWITAVLAATAASFISYGSPPVALAMTYLCVAHRDVKAAIALVAPNVVYIAYYLTLSMMGGYKERVVAMAPEQLLTGMGAQLATFVDAVAGPSMWAKLWYAPAQLSIASAIVGLACGVALWRAPLAPIRSYDRRLLGGLAVLAVVSLAMFAATGQYLQTAFNLGNRVTVLGGVLVAYLVAAAPAPPRVVRLVWVLLLVGVLGVSDHWRDWQDAQRRVIARVAHNPALAALPHGTSVFVSGHQYSRYGPFSHIEFLTENSVAGPILKLTVRDDLDGRILNPRLRYVDGMLVDRKYGTADPIGAGTLVLYDSAADRVSEIPADALNGVLDALPRDAERHWLLLIDAPWVRAVILRVAPRLAYLFERSN